jgi:hypothetical protein
MFRAAALSPGAATGGAGSHGLSSKGYNPSEGKQKDQAESGAAVERTTDPTPVQHLGDEDNMTLDGEAIFKSPGQAIT